MDRPFVSIDPAMQAGEPCVKGSRLRAEVVANAWWGGGYTVQGLEDNWPGVDRATVLVACWYTALHGSPIWKKRWGEWAKAAYGKLWATEYNAVPMPPQDPAAVQARQSQEQEYRVDFRTRAEVVNYAWVEAQSPDEAASYAYKQLAKARAQDWRSEVISEGEIEVVAVKTREQVDKGE